MSNYNLKFKDFKFKKEPWESYEDQILFSPEQEDALKELFGKATTFESFIYGELYLKEEQLFFQSQGKTFSCVVSEEKQWVLEENLKRGFSYFGSVKKALKENTYQGLFQCFSGKDFLGDWKITIKKELMEELKEFNFRFENPERIAKEFLMDWGEPAFVYTTKYDLTKKEEEKGLTRGADCGFRIYGKDCDLLLRIHHTSKTFHVERIFTRKGEKDFIPDKNLFIAFGTLTFTDQIQGIPDSALRKYNETQNEAYVEVWDRYAQIEGELLLSRMRQGGLLVLGDCVDRATIGEQLQFTFTLDNPPEQIKDFPETKGSLVFSSDKPQFLDRTIQWEEYINSEVVKAKIPLEPSKQTRPEGGKKDGSSNRAQDGTTAVEKGSQKRNAKRRNREKTKQYLCNFELHKETSPPTIKLVFQNHKAIPAHVLTASKTNEEQMLEHEGADLPETEKYYLSLYLAGEVENIKRRSKARARMQDGNAANPHMAKILKGTPAVKTRQKADYILSPDMEARIFPQGCSQIQKEAVEIALTSPDMVLIQGPPGTGKTTVITGIIKALNEEMSWSQREKGEILITSYQHDAVDNLSHRLRVNSLPPQRFGGSKNTDPDEVIQTWCQQWSQDFLKKHQHIGNFLSQEKLYHLYDKYEKNPSLDHALAFLSMGQHFSMNQETETLLLNIKKELEWEKESHSRLLLSAIRKLRTSKQGFGDDGQLQARGLVSALVSQGGFSPEEMEKRAKKRYPVLFQARDLPLGEVPSPELLAQFRQLKEELLEEYTPKLVQKKNTPRKDIKELFQRLDREMDGKTVSSPHNRSSETEVLSRLLKQVSRNQQGVKEAMSDYALVYGASIQQSVAKPIVEAKGLSFYKSQWDISFDTVIVDEAARANPMDLMISLTQGRKRLILVGDHRQLPHIYDEEVLDRLQETENISLEDVTVDQSMFEHLMLIAEKLSKIDGIPRMITLNAQYRTHPLLGEFISQQFYEKYTNTQGQQEGFSSPRPAEEFSQSLEDVPLLWHHVPGKLGSQQRAGKSWHRPAEATALVEKLCKYLTQLEREGTEDGSLPLSFGVITFYGGQKIEIEKQIQLLKRQSPHLSAALSQVRVGTVDSFQGMEFDVIFLSLVRCGQPLPWVLPEQEKDLEKLGKQFYGFITKENRLCVALSRQKRLLVVVGDADYYGGGEHISPLVNYAVPAMKHLYDLCKKAGKVENKVEEKLEEKLEEKEMVKEHGLD